MKQSREGGGIMRGRLAIGVVVVVVAVGAWALGVATASPGISRPTVLHVVEHAITDKVIDTGPAGDTSGDLLSFHNPVFDAQNSAKAGNDQGMCIREAPKHGTWECTWTTFVGGGQLTVEGPFYDTRDSVLTVTGGTGIYQNARGFMELRSRAGGTEYDFIFHLIP
jgi:allene oxide cyclase